MSFTRRQPPTRSFLQHLQKATRLGFQLVGHIPPTRHEQKSVKVRCKTCGDYTVGIYQGLYQARHRASCSPKKRS